MDQPVPGVKAIFDRALEIDTPADRQAFLDDACAGAPTLRDQVESLLRAYAEAGSFLERPAAAAAPAGEDDLSPTRLPDSALAAQPLTDLDVWPTVPGYEILGVLGRGGMGVVYKARQIGLGRLVALKMILAGVHAGLDAVARFRREAEAAARLQHPHIVQIHEIGVHDGLPYLSLEYVEGGSLAQKLAGTPLPPRQAAQLVETLARAVHVAHQRGIVHRDLKPGNILLTGDGTPKVADFGLAKRLDDPAGQTASGDILGTPSYMAPEQAGGKHRPVGPAADTYALGAILYDLVTGRPPFKAASAMGTVWQVLHQEPVPPRQLQPKLPCDLETICLKCLRKEPPKRYGNAGDLADDLHRFLRGEPIHARPVRVWERGVKWAKRRPLLAAEVVLLAVVGMGLMVAAVVWRQHQVQQLNDLRAEVGKRVEDGWKALDSGRFQDAQLFLNEAQRKAQAHPELKDLQARAEDLNTEATRRLREAQRRAEADDAAQDFRRLRDEAFLLGSGLLAAVGFSPGPRAADAAAWKALNRVGVTLDGTNGPAEHFDFTPQQHHEVVAGCYELWLLLAELEAQQDHPERGSQALRILERAAQLGLVTRAYHLARARYLRLEVRGAEARDAEAAAADLVPASALDFFLLGVEAHRHGDLPQAEQDFREALDLDRPGDHFWPGYFLALCYLRHQQTDLALATLACLDRQPPSFPWCRLLQGFAYTQLGDFPAAEAAFAKAEEINREGSPDRRREAAYSVRLNRAALRMREAQAADTLAHVVPVAGLVPVGWPGPAPVAEVVREQAYALARDDLERAIALQPKPYQAHARLALLYQARGQFDQALGQLKQALDNSPPEPSVLASLYRQRARLHGGRGNLTDALADWDLVLKSPRPDTPQAQALLAEDYLEKGRMFHTRQRYQEAVQAYRNASKARRDNAEVYYWLGRALLEMKGYAEAVAALDEYQRRKPGPLAPGFYGYRGQALKELGGSLLAAKDRSEADRVYARAVRDLSNWLENHPQDDQVLVLRGWIHLALNEPGSAAVDFEKAIQLNRKSAEPYFSRGYVRAKTSQYDWAIRDVEDALQKGPADARMYLIAAKVFALAVAERPGLDRVTRRRYHEKALMCLQKALDRVPHQAAFWHDHVKRDEDFRLLRKEPQYVKWEKTYSRR
jgi:tetratricopeptide (TPR) repeat protein